MRSKRKLNWLPLERYETPTTFSFWFYSILTCFMIITVERITYFKTSIEVEQVRCQFNINIVAEFDLLTLHVLIQTCTGTTDPRGPTKLPGHNFSSCHVHIILQCFK